MKMVRIESGGYRQTEHIPGMTSPKIHGYEHRNRHRRLKKPLDIRNITYYNESRGRGTHEVQ